MIDGHVCDPTLAQNFWYTFSKLFLANILVTMREVLDGHYPFHTQEGSMFWFCQFKKKEGGLKGPLAEGAEVYF